MSSSLWKAYYDDNVDAFRQLLETAANNARLVGTRGGPVQHIGHAIGSPVAYGSSPSLAARTRKPNTPGSGAGYVLSKTDVNWRDSSGLTLLHHAASSTSETAVGFASALIDHPYIDLSVVDSENGWTALHRAFYFGNVTIARLILERDAVRATGNVNQLIKVKDKEGLGPLDLFAATIKDRTLRPDINGRSRSGSAGSEDDHGPSDHFDGDNAPRIRSLDLGGDQLYSFGSNNNNTLGLGDQDDRQFPERVNIRRPEHLIRRFYQEHLDRQNTKWSAYDSAHQAKSDDVQGMWIEDFPWMVRSKPLVVRDVYMSKLHSAVITDDPESNLYMCGHGKGGRLGTGDERTRFNFDCVEGGSLAGKRVATVALGQNHTLALTEHGEIHSWGNNGFGQLGYGLPRASGDEDPISTVPRQIFGPLKREVVMGIAASRVHSVAHTSSSLYVMGKNDGQLGIVDSDARSLEIQVTPRRVAASLFTSSISAVTAIDRATVCLLENHDVWVFANYGYAKVQFPLEGFSNYFLKQSFLVTTYDAAPNKITKITAAGDSICALSSRGEIYTVTIGQHLENQSSASTTNPAKIRSAITQPQRIWSPKKSNMAARDVGLDVDGSIILTTEEGSVWKRTKRAKIKDASAVGTLEYKPSDYKFSRIPGLTRVLAVRASGHGAYTAVRHDCDVLKTQIVVEDSMLWKDMFPLLSLGRLLDGAAPPNDDDTRHRFWQGSQKPSEISRLKKAILGKADIDAELAALFDQNYRPASGTFDAELATTTSEVRIPVHRFVLAGRSRVLRRGLRDLCRTSTFTIPDLAQSELDNEGRLVVTFTGMDILTILDLALYLYTDTLVGFWHFTRSAPKVAYSYRQVRVELMKIASKLELSSLEPAVRQMVEPRPCLNMDFGIAFADPAFFYDGDITAELEDDSVKLHSALVCARCPFFEGLFMGRAGGRWLAGRADADEVVVDLKHISTKTFSLVMRHLYYDAGSEIFDDIVSTDVDDFLDTVMDVLSAANELMLDRLSQICQSVAGQFVNARNVCGLLNAISPSSVNEFKDAGLEYLCLNLEAMLQGHFLSELDEDLSEELDEVVRANQLACMPFAKSGRAEMLLHERHPELASIIDRNRKTKIDSVSLRSKFNDIAAIAPGSLGEDLSASPMQQKARRRSSHNHKTEVEKPSLKARASTKDMMFDMDEEYESQASPRESPAIRPMPSPRGLEAMQQNTPPVDDTWYNSRGKVLPSPRLAPQASTPSGVTPRTPRSPEIAGRTPPNLGKPWTLTPLASRSSSGLKDIMAQTASGRESSLTQGLAAAARDSSFDIPAPFSLPAPKLSQMSQKDRKRMQHLQQTATVSAKPPTERTESSPFSWQSVSAQKRPGLKDVLQSEMINAAATKAPTTRSASTPHLTMRQTVANPNIKLAPSPKPSPALGTRTASETKSPPPGPATPSTISNFSNSKPIPQSIRHQPLPEQLWGLSMSEIVAQQLAEKDLIKEAAAKRDLQEIQAEQEFQEWWEKESARVQEEEQRAAAGTAKGSAKKGKSRGPRGRGGKVKDGGKENTAAAASTERGGRGGARPKRV